MNTLIATVQSIATKNIHLVGEEDSSTIQKELPLIADRLGFLFASVGGNVVADEIDLLRNIEDAFLFPQSCRATVKPSWDGVRDYMLDLGWLFSGEDSTKIFKGCAVYIFVASCATADSLYNFLMAVNMLGVAAQNIQEVEIAEQKHPFHVFVDCMDRKVVNIFKRMKIEKYLSWDTVLGPHP